MEDEMVGWHHRLNAHEFEQAPGVGDGQGNLVCCSPWGHNELDRTERLSWTGLNWHSIRGMPVCIWISTDKIYKIYIFLYKKALYQLRTAMHHHLWTRKCTVSLSSLCMSGSDKFSHVELSCRLHSWSILAWEIPWTEEPGRLQSMGQQRFGNNWLT